MNGKRIGTALLAAACVFGCVLEMPAARATSSGDAEAAQAARAEAGELTRQGKFADAIAAYRRAIEAEPGEPWTWYALGSLLHGAGDHAGAAEAWKRSLEHKVSIPAVARYNLACARARLGETDAALDLLEEAVAAGFWSAEKLEGDPDLAALRDAPRFAEVANAADLAHRPCRIREVYRQFDFWLGTWDVRIPAGFRAGRDVITKSEDGCVVTQSWTGSLGLNGRSFSWYEPATGEWVQSWIGQAGVTTTMRGRATADGMDLSGLAPGPNGRLRPFRTVWSQNDDGTLRLETFNHDPEDGSWVSTGVVTYHRVEIDAE